jgi:protein-tyrosine phosphatase
MHIPIDDDPSIPINKHFDASHGFIEQGSTLVHCYAGISRSATVVISYLMKKYNMHLYQALQHCRKIRPIVKPNQGFIRQLIEYDMYLKTLAKPPKLEPEPEPDSDTELIFPLE